MFCSPTSPQTEAITEFCVIHIEDGPEQVTSEPVGSPVRTMAKPQLSEVAKKAHHIPNTETIPLPGTPDTNHTHTDHDASDSSISSEVSVKSTDALIMLGKN